MHRTFWLVLALWILGVAVLGIRWVLFLFSTAYETVSPQYVAVSYLMPLLFFFTIPMGALVFLGVEQSGRVGKGSGKGRVAAIWLGFAAIYYFFWSSSLPPFSLGYSLFWTDTGIITIPFVLSLSLTTIVLRLRKIKNPPTQGKKAI